MKPPLSQSQTPADTRLRAMRALVDETVALFHGLRAAASLLHGEGETSAGRRGVLQGLARAGPQTVPQMARTRLVSRQHIQVLVDALREDGLVELMDNPAHRRSRLVRLTRRAAATCRRMELIERRVFSSLGRHLPAGELEIAVRTLRSLRLLLGNEAAWCPAKKSPERGRKKR